MLDIGGSIESTIELAPRAEQLGFSRFWIAEHQPQPSPIVIATLVAGQTSTIRVGTAGVLLHYYPPARTAFDFQLLERAFTGRIDAGFCGGITPFAKLIEDDRDGRDMAAVMAAYPQRVETIVRYLRNADPAVAWAGASDAPPEIWSLGGGERSADLAARLGISFGYALMFPTGVDDPAVVRRYRERFAPYGDGARPRVAVAVAGICAETDALAGALARTRRSTHFAPRVVGSPTTCAAALADFRERYDADDLVFADLCDNLDDRVRCYELLACAIG